MRLVGQEGPELSWRRRPRGLGEVEGAFKAMGAGGVEGGGELGDVADLRVAAEVDAHDAEGCVLDSQGDDGAGRAEGVAPVDGED